MNIFYTATVYEKGAEVIRMIETFLGKEGFRKGMDLYFERHNGQAVTTEDFVRAMSDANGYDFTQFEQAWYNRAGTPTLHIESSYDEQAQQLKLTIRQSCRETKGVEPTPFYLPLAIGLVGQNGKDIPLALTGSNKQTLLERGILIISQEQEEFLFSAVKAKPVLSLNRGFKAPVKIDYNYSFEDLAFLFAHDSDDFNRYNAMQELSKWLIKQLVEQKQQGGALEIPSIYDEAFAGLLSSSISDAIKSYCMELPAVSFLKLEYNPIPFKDLIAVTKFIKKHLASKFTSQLKAIYQQCQNDKFALDANSIGQRMLKNRALSYLAQLEEELVMQHFFSATNMTDEISALTLIADSNFTKKAEALEQFLDRYKQDKLVVDEWFSVQAQSTEDGTLEVVKSLLQHPLYDKTNPNSVRAVLGVFIGNHAHFHSAKGYQFITEQLIAIDKMNPQLASRLMMGFRDYGKLPAELKELMGEQLKVLQQAELSNNTREILQKILAI
jgi:aminopeptidase N